MSERYKSSVLHTTEWGTQVRLTCHFKFELATEEQKFSKVLGGGKSICNGCGPSGYGGLIPDSILGVCVTITGHIHNWGYQFGTDREDKMVVDETFGDNMDRIIRDYYETEYAKLCGGKFVSFRTWLALRKYKARLALADKAYENAVVVFGKSAFWDKRKIGFGLGDVY